MEAPSVTLGDCTTTLAPCDVLDALDFNLDDESKLGQTKSVQMAMGAGLLAICWPAEVAWPARKRPRPWSLMQGKLTAVEYGREVFKGLLNAGIPLQQVGKACGSARNWAPLSALPSEAEVKAAQDFSEAPTASGA